MLDQLSNINEFSLYALFSLGISSGFLGSVHCVGMCGGLVSATTKTKLEVSLYHIGRLLGYITLGVLLPVLGMNIIGIKHSNELKLISAILIGLSFILIGFGPKVKKTGIFKFFIKNLQVLNNISYQFIFKRFKNFHQLRAFFIGSVSALLPCGLLWIVLILSLTTSSAIYALSFIISFWLGTLPALSFTPVIIQKMIRPIQNRAPMLMSSAFVFIGVLTIAFRLFNYYHLSKGGMTCH